MHNNFFFLRALAVELDGLLQGFTLVSSFSQSKDELVIEFNNGTRSIFLKASLLPELQCLSFPATFHRARRNSIDLFSEVLMKPVTGVYVFRNERSLGIRLEDAYEIIFKMHGQQANVILVQQGKVVSVFRNNFPADQTLDPALLHRDIDWSFESFQQHQQDLASYYTTLGTLSWDHLNHQGFPGQPVAARWRLFENLLRQLNDPTFSITIYNHTVRLVLFPIGKIEKTHSSPSEAISDFFLHYQATVGFERKKAQLLSAISGRLSQAQSFVEKNKARLSAAEQDEHYQLWGDLIMANLHHLKAGSTLVDLENYHEPGKMISIKLKKELTPQRNAEIFFRKAKNKAIEIAKLRESIERKEAELLKLSEQHARVIKATLVKELEPLLMVFSGEAKAKEQKQGLPYHEHTYNGFRIWVGKSAQANDELTRHYTHKDDLWLHARDVAGSHVVIKQEAGKPFPKDVIQFAASLAAYHSKRKNETLCPVAVTQAKYVRKRKGDPPGSVVVQREEVMMAVPKKGA